MKIIFLLLLGFSLSGNAFKSFEAEFTFSHHEFGDFKMTRKFMVDGSTAQASFKLRPLLIFEYSQKSKDLQAKLNAFMEEHVVPVEAEFVAFHQDPKNRWTRWSKTEELKQKAKDAGLWNLFLPKDYGDLSPGLTNDN